MKKQILEEIEKLNDGEISLVAKFVDNLTKKVELLPVFAEKLEAIKNNPIDEPKILAKQKEIEEKATSGDMDITEVLLEVIEAVCTIEEIEELEREYNLTIQDLVRFGGAISEKVFGLKEIVDGEEVFKEIPSHAELKPVPYSKKREIREQVKKYDNALKNFTEYVKNEKREDAKVKKLEDEIKKQNKLLDEKINQAHNLDTSNMSKWEKDLLKQKVLANSYGTYMPPMGKRLVP